jgi:hypothetical protein
MSSGASGMARLTKILVELDELRDKSPIKTNN